MLWKSKEAADYLNLAVRTVTRLARKKKIPIAGRVGKHGQYLFKKDSLDNWIYDNKRI